MLPGMSTSEVSSKIKGEVGTKVKVTIYRESENNYLDFEIERAEIKIYHVEEEMLENNIGYICLYTFDEGCADEFKEAYNKLKSEGAQKIILDLRDNTGGLVDEALSIIDMFLPKNETMLITVDSTGEEEYSKSTEDTIIDTENVVVLVNEYSASASEILVGALKDNERATIVGTKTYGKGVIQSVFMLEDGSALKLTTSEYYTPNKVKINKIGIDPDYVVELDSEQDGDEQLNKAIELLK
jgi:carboxyl-terminal processing protease